jgi:hypothetical protein
VYVHDKLLVTPPAGIPAGSYLAETFPGPTPPISHDTGEPHPCSKVLSPFYLQRLEPGAGDYYEDAEPGILVKNFGTKNCSLKADGYHLHSIFDDAVPGGSCEKELVDYCGVPVENNPYNSSAGDRTVFNGTLGFAALTAAFNGVYNDCIQVIDNWYSAWDWAGCDFTAEQIMCDRAAWQVTNEVLMKAYPQEYYGLGANGPGTFMEGWSDFNVIGPPPVWGLTGNPPPNYNNWSGTMMGSAKSNGQLMPNPPYSGCNVAPPLYNGSSVAPGNCDTGSCNGPPVKEFYPQGNASGESCWAPPAFTANIPQNILNAATRLKAVQQTVAVGSGITASYDTCTSCTICVNTKTCDED